MEKIQELTDKLYREGVEKGNAEVCAWWKKQRPKPIN